MHLICYHLEWQSVFILYLYFIFTILFYSFCLNLFDEQLLWKKTMKLNNDLLFSFYTIWSYKLSSVCALTTQIYLVINYYGYLINKTELHTASVFAHRYRLFNKFYSISLIMFVKVYTFLPILLHLICDFNLFLACLMCSLNVYFILWHLVY